MRILHLITLMSAITACRSNNKATDKRSTDQPSTNAELALGTVEGTIIDQLAENFTEGWSERQVFLQKKSEKGKMPDFIKLALSDDELSQVHHGDEVRIKGDVGSTPEAGLTLFSADEIEVIKPANDGLQLTAAINGDVKVGVVIITQNNLTTVQGTTANLQQQIFDGPNSVKNYYAKLSHYNPQTGTGINLVGTMLGVVNLPTDLDYFGSCLTNQMKLKAKEILNGGPGATTDITKQFAQMIYVALPPNNCTVGGLAVVGEAIIVSNAPSGDIGPIEYPHVIAHELGHAMMQWTHAAGYGAEYGESWEPMGRNGGGLFYDASPNPGHQILGHVLDATDNLEVTAPGVFHVDALNGTPGTLKVLTIPRPNGNVLTVHYRTNLGLDARLTTDPQNTQPHLFNHPPNYTAIGAYLPAGNPGCFVTSPPNCLKGVIDTYWFGDLLDGQSFTDTDSGVIITQVSHDAVGANIQVDFNPAVKGLVHVAPTVTALHTSGVANPSLYWNGPYSWNISITNNDPVGFPPSLFGYLDTSTSPIKPSIPSMPNTLEPLVLIAPGETKNLAFVGTAPGDLTATPGPYTGMLQIWDNIAQEHLAQVQVTFNNKGSWDPSLPIPGAPPTPAPVPTPPPPPATLSKPIGVKATVTPAKQVSVAWTPNAAAQQIKNYQILRANFVIGTAVTPPFVDTTVKLGLTYSYTVKAVTTAGKVSVASLASSIKVPAPPAPVPAIPTAPKLVKATLTATKQVALTWTANVGAQLVTSYRIFRNNVQIGTSTTPSFTDTTVVPATAAYSYTVKAANSAAKISPASVTVKIIVK